MQVSTRCCRWRGDILWGIHPPYLQVFHNSSRYFLTGYRSVLIILFSITNDDPNSRKSRDVISIVITDDFSYDNIVNEIRSNIIGLFHKGRSGGKQPFIHAITVFDFGLKQKVDVVIVKEILKNFTIKI